MIESHECCSNAVILGKKEQIGKLFSLLENSYQRVTLAETAGELDNLRKEKQSPILAVITDSFPEILNIELINRVRQYLNPENMICLSKDDNQEKEKVLRSAGLIFFGSYMNFFTLAEKIINQTLSESHNRHENLINSRKETARALEQRLTGNSTTLKSLFKQAVFRIAATAAEVLARFIELLVALSVTLILTIPVLTVLFFRKLFTGSPVFDTKIISGVHSKPVKIYRFSNTGASFKDLPLFFELFSGKLALTGRAIKDWDENGSSAENAYINRMKPGIVSLWDIRRASKTAHEGQQAIEWEYIFKKHLVYDFFLLLRAVPVMLYSEKSVTASSIFPLMGLELNNLTMNEAVSVIETTLDKKKQCSVFFVNPDCLNKMVSDPDYFSILKTGCYVFPDGIGLAIAGKMLRTPLRENINGTDMLPFLCRMAAAKGASVFLLGGKPGIAEMAGKKISETYGVAIAGTSDGYFNHMKESEAVIERINNSGAAILLVAFGAPLQEKWIASHRLKLTPLVTMGVGGLFDFYSGTIKRAPRWMREIGMEWVYRIIQEPGRMWRRYVIGNPLFLYRVIKWKMFTQSNAL